MCFFFFFFFVFLHGLERDFDHLANGTSFLSPLHWGNLCFANFFPFTYKSAFLYIAEKLYSKSTERFEGVFVSPVMKSNCQMFKMSITYFSVCRDHDLIGTLSVILVTMVLVLLIFWVWFVRIRLSGSRKLNVTRWTFQKRHRNDVILTKNKCNEMFSCNPGLYKSKCLPGP